MDQLQSFIAFLNAHLSDYALTVLSGAVVLSARKPRP